LFGGGKRRGQRRVVFDNARVSGNQASDTEIQQSRPAVDGDPDVGRLDVTVNDLALVGVRYGLRDLDEQLQATTPIDTFFFPAFGEVLALDPLHDQVILAVAKRTAVEDSSDVGVVQTRQQPSFHCQAFGHERVVGGADELDCRAHFERAVCAFGPVHQTHAADAGRFEQAPLVDARAGRKRILLQADARNGGVPGAFKQRLQERSGLHRSLQQALQPGMYARMAAREFAHARRALGAGQFQHDIEQRVEHAPTRRRQAVG